jgi:hypothetical protein
MRENERKCESRYLALKPLQKASTPYKSLIYGQNKHEFAGKPGKGRDIMREITGKIPSKVGQKKR